MFGLPDAARHEKIKENILPVTVLASFVLASVAVPLVPRWAGPLAVAQARKPQPSEDLISDSREGNPKLTQMTRSHTVTAGSTRSKRTKDGGRITSTPDLVTSGVASGNLQHRSTEPSPSRPDSAGSRTPVETKRLPPHLNMKNDDARLSSSSLPLPDLRSPRLAITRPTTPVSAGLPQRPGDSLARRHSLHFKSGATAAELTPLQKTRLLRQHYFRCETQFLTALEGISNRLVIVPKPARLSALRAELALIAQDLPAEVDVPVICPPTLVDGSPAKSRHHRIVRLNPTESTVLNSAEKVPYLLMVEVLRDDFTFDPDTPDNKRLLATLLSDPTHTRRIFDLSDSPRIPIAPKTPEPVIDSVFEPVSGDLGSSPMLKPFDEDTSQRYQGKQPSVSQPQRLPSNTTAMSSVVSEMITPRSSGASTSRSNSPPGPLRKMTISTRGNTSVDQPDFSALATHMRTASQMLAQLEATSGKRPRHEVQAIRAKIIASMQSLEEQSFDMDEQGPTFDTIIAKASTAQANNEPPEVEGESPVEPGLNAGAGLARMENDIKTGGIQSKGDRDDPSAAVFGEAWQAKKERIRKTSPYGWMKNWDLVSVIVKTGADLRQEAFACQLIDVCHKIWVDAEVNVWVKLMRILVTGESSGLIETITNGVSLHSIKRSLTLSIETAPNQKRRFATLRDHFLKAFGAADSEPYRAGVDAFKRSLAAYSMISYILQLKDRHNGNVLIDSEGHIVHIDFGFMLSNSPGSVGFEAAPFKLTQEYIEVLGGIGSDDYEDYKKLCKQAFQGMFDSQEGMVTVTNL